MEKCEIGIQTDDLPADPLFEMKSVDDEKHNNSMSSPSKRVELNPNKKQSQGYSDCISTGSYQTSNQENRFDYQTEIYDIVDEFDKNFNGLQQLWKNELMESKEAV